MLIKFSKHANRPPTLNCIREDGTATWFTASAANSDYFVAHDLLHYAVESSLGYTSAFFGMVAAGRDLNDFGSTNGVADVRPISLEAADAERIVGFVQVMSASGATPLYETVTDAWRTSDVQEASLEPPLTEAQLTDICALWSKLMGRWQTTEVPGVLELSFPAPVV
ncbi:MAG: hypothetical protein ACYC96_08545 [Fimbriimonadaceae bacterium]